MIRAGQDYYTVEDIDQMRNMVIKIRDEALGAKFDASRAVYLSNLIAILFAIKKGDVAFSKERTT